VVSNFTLNNNGLLTVFTSAKGIKKKINPKNYQDIAVAMLDLSRNHLFLSALAELSKISEFIIHMYQVYSFKLNANSSGEGDLLLVEEIRTALPNCTKRVPN
jgi:hypothetical protein